MLIELMSAAMLIAPQEAAPAAQDPGGPQMVAPRGSYSRTCSGDYVNRGRLYADCRDDRGQIRGTSIELNRCADYDISNRNGLLVCGPVRGDYEDRNGNNGWGNGNNNGWGNGNNNGWDNNGRPGPDDIVVYRDSRYRGESRRLNGAVPDLGRFGLNDQISSIQLQGEWTLCSDANFRGMCRTFNGFVPDLGQFGLNDRVSSMRPGRYDGDNGWGNGNNGWGNGNNGWGDNNGWGNGGWGNNRDEALVYRDSDFRGPARSLTGEVADLDSMGLNDAISSMRFRGEWEACTDAYFRGYCQRFSGDVRNLSNIGMNDRISSLRPARRSSW